MTRPGNRPPSQTERRLAASLSGAVDLAGLKSRAEAAKEAARTPGSAGAAAAPTVVDVDEQSFEQDVLIRSDAVPVVVELGSARAPSQMAPVLEELARAGGGRWVYARVDVDSSPMIAQAFQVRAVPTVIAVAAGRPFAEFEGEQPRDSLEQWIAAVLRATDGKLSGAPAQADPGTEDAAGEEPADPQRDAAEQALADGDLAAAEKAFSELVEQRGGDHSLLEALRFVQASRRVAEAGDREAGGAPGEGGPVADAVAEADRLLVDGEPAAAFARLVDAVRVTSGDDRTAVRTRLLELLDCLPADDPQVLAARRNLAAALY